jgi:hypothetical protein
LERRSRRASTTPEQRAASDALLPVGFSLDDYAATEMVADLTRRLWTAAPLASVDIAMRTLRFSDPT